MAEEALSHAGLYLDELNKIRLLEPESATQTTELKDECKEFVDSMIYFLLFFLFISILLEISRNIKILWLMRLLDH